MKDLRAYKIMLRFLEERYSRLPSDALGAPLGELDLRDDGSPGDLAIVEDWERAVAGA
jgi:hypothetical protein